MVEIATKNSSCELSKQTQLEGDAASTSPFWLACPVKAELWGICIIIVTLRFDSHVLCHNQAFAHTDTNILVLFSKRQIYHQNRIGSMCKSLMDLRSIILFLW